MATSLSFSAPKLTTNLSIGEVRIGIVVSLWNGHITSKLLEGAENSLTSFQNSHPHQISYDIIQVPGAFEIPTAAQWLLEENYNAIICLGCVIKGDTPHFDYVCNAVTDGINTLALKYSKPCIFGIITTFTNEQAEERAGGILGNKGSEAAEAAIWMLETKHNIKQTK